MAIDGVGFDSKDTLQAFIDKIKSQRGELVPSVSYYQTGNKTSDTTSWGIGETGTFTITLSTAMPDTDYIVVPTLDVVGVSLSVHSKTVNDFKVTVRNDSAETIAQPITLYWQAFKLMTDESRALDEAAIAENASDISELQDDKQDKTLETPLTIDGTSQTTVEGALGGLNGLVPSGASTSNKLVTDSMVNRISKGVYLPTISSGKRWLVATITGLGDEGFTVTIDDNGGNHQMFTGHGTNGEKKLYRVYQNVSIWAFIRGFRKSTNKYEIFIEQSQFGSGWLNAFTNATADYQDALAIEVEAIDEADIGDYTQLTPIEFAEKSKTGTISSGSTGNNSVSETGYSGGTLVLFEGNNYGHGVFLVSNGWSGTSGYVTKLAGSATIDVSCDSVTSGVPNLTISTINMTINQTVSYTIREL